MKKVLGFLFPSVAFLVFTPFKLLFLFLKRLKCFLEGINNFKEKHLLTRVMLYWQDDWPTPNEMTIFRIFLGLGLFPMAYHWGFVGNYVIFPILLLAIATDFLDGLVARAKKLQSRLGSLLDKIADKTLVIPLGVYEFLEIDPALAWWSVIGTVFVTLTAIACYFWDKEVPENIFGKAATVFYFIAIVLPIWQAAWPLAQLLGWTGFSLGVLSALYNFAKFYGKGMMTNAIPK